MAVSHVKSNTVADFTGTVTVFNSQGSTATIAATDLVRPVDWNSGHNQFFTLTGNTTGNSTASGTNVILAASGGVSIGGSTGSIVISGPAPIAGFNPFNPGAEQILGQMGQSTLYLHEVFVPHAAVVNQLRFPVHFTGASNSTGSMTLSQGLALYSVNNSTQITRLASWEVSTNVSHNGTQNSASNVGGLRTWSQTVAQTTVEAGRYIVGFLSKTATAGANLTMSNFIVSNINTAISGALNSANNASQGIVPFQGSYSAQTAGFPDSIGTAAMRGTAAVAWGRPPVWSMCSY